MHWHFATIRCAFCEGGVMNLDEVKDSEHRVGVIDKMPLTPE
jgi:hypothetical protein